MSALNKMRLSESWIHQPQEDHKQQMIRDFEQQQHKHHSWKDKLHEAREHIKDHEYNLREAKRAENFKKQEALENDRQNTQQREEIYMAAKQRELEIQQDSESLQQVKDYMEQNPAFSKFNQIKKKLDRQMKKQNQTENEFISTMQAKKSEIQTKQSLLLGQTAIFNQDNQQQSVGINEELLLQPQRADLEEFQENIVKNKYQAKYEAIERHIKKRLRLSMTKQSQLLVAVQKQEELRKEREVIEQNQRYTNQTELIEGLDFDSLSIEKIALMPTMSEQNKKPKPIQRVMNSPGVFPDIIQIDSGLGMDGENPIVDPKKNADSFLAPFNNEICSVAKGIYLDLGPATRFIAPTAQVFCSLTQKALLKKKNKVEEETEESESEDEESYQGSDQSKKPKKKKKGRLTKSQQDEIKRKKYEEFQHLKALKAYPYLKRVDKPIYYYQRPLQKKDVQSSVADDENYESTQKSVDSKGEFKGLLLKEQAAHFESMALYHILGLSKWSKLAKSGLVPYEFLKNAPYELYEDFEDEVKDICIDSKEEKNDESQDPEIAGQKNNNDQLLEVSYGDEYNSSAFKYTSEEYNSTTNQSASAQNRNQNEEEEETDRNSKAKKNPAINEKSASLKFQPFEAIEEEGQDESGEEEDETSTINHMTKKQSGITARRRQSTRNPNNSMPVVQRQSSSQNNSNYHSRR